MQSPRCFWLVSLAVVLGGCAESWHAGPTVLADPRDVAAALGDPPPDTRSAIGDLPRLEPPHHPRYCCAFGMDMQVDFAGMHVPFFEVSNIVDVDALGHHAYAIPDAMQDPESNGLLYTCRGGWIDTSHVREYADTLLFLALQIARGLETGTTITIPGNGAPTTITIAPVPTEVIRRDGALGVAGALAAWATYRIAIWHEVSTWYGYEFVSGFSERPSAFSLEDLYSDVLGMHLALAVLDERQFQDEADYDRVLEAFIEQALERLEVQPRETSRAIMHALDGRWWDSTRRLPDDHLVMRRLFPPSGRQIEPWRAEEAFTDIDTPEPLASVCRGAETRPLALPTRIGHLTPRELVVITFAPEGWADASFPFADPSRHIVDERELDRLTTDVHAAMHEDLGDGFDQPGPSPVPTELVAS